MTPVERVARAIFEAEPVYIPGLKWHHTPDVQKRYLTQAHAAIEALREPAEKMRFQGARALGYRSKGSHIPDMTPWLEDAERCWQAMIDALLNEEPNDG